MVIPRNMSVHSKVDHLYIVDRTLHNPFVAKNCMKLHKPYLDLTVYSYTVNIHDLSFQRQGNVRLSDFNMTGQAKMCLLSAFRFGVQVGIRRNTKTFLWTKKKKTSLRMKCPQEKPFLRHRFHILCLHLHLISVKIDYKLKECIKGTLTVCFFFRSLVGVYPPGK